MDNPILLKSNKDCRCAHNNIKYGQCLPHMCTAWYISKILIKVYHTSWFVLPMNIRYQVIIIILVLVIFSNVASKLSRTVFTKKPLVLLIRGGAEWRVEQLLS